MCSGTGCSLSKLGLAFPPSDKGIAAFLTKPGPVDERYYLNFLAHVFQRVATELNTAFHGAEKGSYEDLAAKWRAHLDSPGVREALYSSIEHTAGMEWGKHGASGPDKGVSLRS